LATIARYSASVVFEVAGAATSVGDLRRLVVERRFQRRHHRVEPRLGALVGDARHDAGRRTHRRHYRHLVARRVEDDYHRGAHEQRVGHADRIGLGRRQPLHMAHHVVAEIAEHARRHRRQSGRHVDVRFGEQRAQCVERLAGAGDERVGIDERAAIDLGACAGRTPDDVGVEADHRIAAALRAAFDRLEQEHIAGPADGELEIGRDRRLEIGDQGRHDHARAPGAVAAGEIVVVGRAHRRHRAGLNCPSQTAGRCRGS
jgi:hypothetical protein